MSKNEIEVKVNGWGNTYYKTKNGYGYQNMATPERMASKYERNYRIAKDTCILYNEDGSIRCKLWRHFDRFGCGPWKRQLFNNNKDNNNNNDDDDDDDDKKEYRDKEEEELEQATCPLPKEEGDKVDNDEKSNDEDDDKVDNDEKSNDEDNVEKAKNADDEDNVEKAKNDDDEVDNNEDNVEKAKNADDEENVEKAKNADDEAEKDLEDMWSNFHDEAKKDMKDLEDMWSNFHI